MKRWTLRILSLLLIGAIVNVAVAWIPTWEFMPDVREHVSDLPSSEGDRIWEHRLPANWPKGWVTATRREYPRKTVDIVQNDENPNAATHQMVRRRSGWPVLSMEGFERFEQFGNPSQTFESAIELEFVSDSPQGRVARYMFVPLRPIWPGFAINTVFYAAILFALCFGFGQGRRIIRLCRGRCARCGYDLRGNESGKCSECGAKL